MSKSANLSPLEALHGVPAPQQDTQDLDGTIAPVARHRAAAGDGMGEAQRTIARQMTEASVQAKVIELAEWLRLDWFHVPDMRRTNAGLPDLTIVGDGRLWLFEAKTQRGPVRRDQRRILERLGETGTYTARLIRPADWLSGEIERLLTHPALSARDGGGEEVG